MPEPFPTRASGLIPRGMRDPPFAPTSEIREDASSPTSATDNVVNYGHPLGLLILESWAHTLRPPLQILPLLPREERSFMRNTRGECESDRPRRRRITIGSSPTATSAPSHEVVGATSVSCAHVSAYSVRSRADLTSVSKPALVCSTETRTRKDRSPDACCHVTR